MTTFLSLLQRVADSLGIDRSSELRDLDARTLVDIGLHPSEIDSIEPGWPGHSEPTRTRSAGTIGHA